jgi:hypothetical protein
LVAVETFRTHCGISSSESIEVNRDIAIPVPRVVEAYNIIQVLGDRRARIVVEDIDTDTSSTAQDGSDPVRNPSVFVNLVQEPRRASNAQTVTGRNDDPHHG